MFLLPSSRAGRVRARPSVDTPLICLHRSGCQPLSVSLSVFLTLSSFGCLTPHTRFASLVSRTLATRTVMSSMRSWILQLWPRLPALEALLTLALGTLSSMQPSSLAHTSACHYRPFPSDFGLKVHRLTHPHPLVQTPSHASTSLYIFHSAPLSAVLVPPVVCLLKV